MLINQRDLEFIENLWRGIPIRQLARFYASLILEHGGLQLSVSIQSIEGTLLMDSSGALS